LSAFAYLLFFLPLSIGVTPVLAIMSLLLFMVCIRYLILNRLSGRQKIVAIFTSIISVALAVACGLYFLTILQNI
jgi:hypothetical protein